MKAQGKDDHSKLRGEDSEEMNYAGMGFQPTELYEYKLLLFKPPSLSDFGMIALGNIIQRPIETLSSV